jgi:ERCC4-type nuclease
MSGPVIIIDTREQAPLAFSLPTERGMLVSGDYSIKGLERFIAIERKSPNDLVGCLKGEQRERFERELSRLRGLDYGALVVECDLAALAAGRYRSKMKPQGVVQSLMAFSVRYRLPVFFCPDRAYAAGVTESLLTKYAAEIERRFKSLVA